MQPSRDHRTLAQKIGLTASVLALGAIGLLTLTGNYLPRSQAFFLSSRQHPHTYTPGFICEPSAWEKAWCHDNRR